MRIERILKRNLKKGVLTGIENSLSKESEDLTGEEDLYGPYPYPDEDDVVQDAEEVLIYGPFPFTNEEEDQ